MAASKDPEKLARQIEHLKPYQFDSKRGKEIAKLPRRRSITRAIRDVLNRECLTDGGKRRLIRELFAEAGINHGIEGNFGYWKEIIDRVDGPVPRQVVMGDQVNVAVQINWRDSPAAKPNGATGSSAA